MLPAAGNTVMKITNYVTTTPFDVEHGMDRAWNLRDWAAYQIENAVEAVHKTLAKRRRAAKLMSLNDRVLEDIGISEAEIRQLRARRLLLPPGWME